jgi:hypothetical protein
MSSVYGRSGGVVCAPHSIEILNRITAQQKRIRDFDTIIVFTSQGFQYLMELIREGSLRLSVL